MEHKNDKQTKIWDRGGNLLIAPELAKLCKSRHESACGNGDIPTPWAANLPIGRSSEAACMQTTCGSCGNQEIATPMIATPMIATPMIAPPKATPVTTPGASNA